jgi:hypothetical protein
MEEFEMAIATMQVRSDDDIRNAVLEELKRDPKITSSTGKYELFKTDVVYDATAKNPHWLG